jgi:hypothetical protein
MDPRVSSENFDALGQGERSTRDADDAPSIALDGMKVDGRRRCGLRWWGRKSSSSRQCAGLTGAVGRQMEHYDAPAIRGAVR